MKRLSAPLDVQIEVTGCCNQKCRHCYNFWRHSPVRNPRELETKDFISIFRQLREVGVGQVTLTGGEPTLRMSVLQELIKKAHVFGFDVGMNSNAVLIGKEDALRMRKGGLSHALISVLGPRNIHNYIVGKGGEFDKTIEGIKHLIDAGIPVSVNMPISKLNMFYVRETANAVKDLGLRAFCAGQTIPSCESNISLCLSIEECKACLKDLLWVEKEMSTNIDILEPLPRCMFSQEDEKEFARFFGNRICSAAVSSCVISSSGEMRPCIHSDVSYGSVLSDKFSVVWHKMGEWASPEILPSECRECKALFLCEGGCRMSAKVVHGSYSGHDMYMIGAIKSDERAGIFPPASIVEAPDQNDLLRFNPRCVLRKEKEGGVAFTSGRVEHVSDKGLDFLRLIKEEGTFSCRSLAQQTEYNVEAITNVITRLIGSRIVEKTKSV